MTFSGPLYRQRMLYLSPGDWFFLFSSVKKSKPVFVSFLDLNKSFLRKKGEIKSSQKRRKGPKLSYKRSGVTFSGLLDPASELDS